MSVPRFWPTVETNFRAIPSFAPVVPQADTGTDEMFAGAGAMLDRVSDMTMRLEADRVRQEAYNVGVENAALPGFDPNGIPQDASIASEAYRRGAVTTFTTQLELDLTKNLNRITQEYNAKSPDEQDPTVLDAALAGYIGETANRLPAVMRGGFQQTALSRTMPLVQQATNQHLQYVQTKAANNAKAAIEVLQSELIANPLPANPAEQKAYDNRMASLRVAYESLGYTPIQIQAATQTFLQNLSESRLVKEFERSPNQPALLQQLHDTPAEKMGITQAQKGPLLNQLEAMYINRNIGESVQLKGLSFEQTTDLAKLKADLFTRIDAAQDVSDELIQYGRRGLLTPQEVEEGLKKIGAVGLEKSKELNALNTLAGGGVLDPNTPAYDKTIDSFYESLVASGRNNFVSPLTGHRVVSDFGKRVQPKTGASTDHHGIDIDYKENKPVFNAMAGRVIFSGIQKGYGNTVIIRQSDGHQIRYAHLNELRVKQGQTVQSGDLVGLSGRTGNVTGPHLHVEVLNARGQYLDPKVYFNGAQGFSGMTPLQAARQIYDTQRVIPKAFTGQVLRLWRGTPEEMSQAANMVDTLMDDGVPLDQMPGISEGDLKRMLAFNTDMQKGYTAAQARERYIKSTDPSNANLRQFYQQEAKKYEKSSQYSGQHLLIQGGVFGQFQTDTSRMMLQSQKQQFLSDWQELFKDGFESQNGDPDAAKRYADKQIARRWGVSYSTGQPVTMKYPPESYYQLPKVLQPYAPKDWLSQDLKNAVSAVPSLSAAGKGVKSIFLVPDEITQREAASGKPSYQIIVMKGGEFQPLVKEGRLQRWRPDVSQVIKQAERTRNRKTEAAIRNAKQQRNRNYLENLFFRPTSDLTGGLQG